MAHIVMENIFSFSTNGKEILNSLKALSFSDDSQFLVCCREMIIVFTLSSDLREDSMYYSKSLPCQLFAQQIIDLSAIPSFKISEDVLDLPTSYTNISRTERQDLITDTSLYSDAFFCKTLLGGFRHALFSPQSSVTRGSMIVAVTADNRVFVFQEQLGVWALWCEMTGKIKSHTTESVSLPLTLGCEDMTLKNCKALVYSMCCVDVAWSSPFHIKVSNDDSTLSEAEVFLLFCGMRNGDSQVWQLKTTLDPVMAEDSLSFVAVDSFPSEVTSLCWHLVRPGEGYIAVGYMDGGVRIVSVVQSDQALNGFQLTERLKHDPKDLLAIFDLAATQLADNVSIVVALKQYLINIYRVQDERTDFVKTIHIDCSLPLESISMRGRTGSVTGQDGGIYHFLFDIDADCDDIKVQYMKTRVTCLPNDMDLIWSCRGVALSRSGALCLSVHCPISDFNINRQSHSRFLARQRIVLTFAPYFTNDEFILPSNAPIPSSSFGIYDSPMDLTVRLAIVMHHAFKNKSSLEMIEETLNKLIASQRHENLQVAQAIYRIDYYRIHKTVMNPKALKSSSKEKCQDLMNEILIQHVSTCFQLAIESFDNVEEAPNGWLSLSSMYRWAISDGKKLKSLSQYVSENVLSRLAQVSAVSPQLLCVLCEAELVTYDKESLMEVKCSNGHSSPLCCLTLSPIGGAQLRHCASCKAVAMTTDQIESCMPFIRTRNLCSICGGRLQQ